MPARADGLVSGCGAAYHTNPTEAAKIGELVEKYHGTLLVSTPTFYAGYTRKCTAEQFASLRFALVGAEKLREPIAAAFREKFGVELLEGYGCTEMAPVVAVNAPNFEAGKDTQVGNKPGTVGHPIPGVAAQVVDRCGALAGRRARDVAIRHTRPASALAEMLARAPIMHRVQDALWRASKAGDIFSPSSSALLRLIKSSYLRGDCTGRSPGFVPRRIRLTYSPPRTSSAGP